MDRVVVALGGNALLREDEGDAAAQRERIDETAAHVARLFEQGYDVVLTHGNGPQVGALLLQQEHVDTAAQPLDVLVAETQAQLGYLLAQALDAHLDRRVVAVVTRVVVNPDDPAFDRATKPVGPTYSADEASEKPFETTTVKTDSEETRYRRVVPSPEPLEVVESDAVRTLVESESPVVCAGGGGVPVVREDDVLRGVEAVVDKDLTSGLVATDLDAAILASLTDVENAFLDYGTDQQTAVGEISADRLREHLDDGEFEEGSMKPKVEACLRFVEAGGERAIITTPELLDRALAGEAGTRVVR